MAAQRTATHGSASGPTISNVFASMTEAVGGLPPLLAFGILAVLAAAVLGWLGSIGKLSVEAVVLIGTVVLACLYFYDANARRTLRSSMGPLGRRRFEDRHLGAVTQRLGELHYADANLLRTELLVPQLLRLFDRKTFNESVFDCRDADWGARLRAAIQTMQVLRAYEENVRLLASARERRGYRNLLLALDGYCMEMAGRLFHPPVTLSTLEGRAHERKWFSRQVSPLKDEELTPQARRACERRRLEIQALLGEIRVAELECRLENANAVVEDLTAELDEARKEAQARRATEAARCSEEEPCLSGPGRVVAAAVAGLAAKGPEEQPTHRVLS